MGQVFFARGTHSEQTHRWPQGVNATSADFDMQMTHSPAFARLPPDPAAAAPAPDDDDDDDASLSRFPSRFTTGSAVCARGTNNSTHCWYLFSVGPPSATPAAAAIKGVCDPNGVFTSALFSISTFKMLWNPPFAAA